MLRDLFIALSLLLVSWSAVALQPSDKAVTSADLDSGSLKPSMWYLEDADHAYDLAEVQSRYSQGQFTKTTPNFNFGYSKSIFWLHFSLKLGKADTEHPVHDILLEFKYPHLDQVEIYRTSESGTIKQFEAFGDIYPHDLRPIDNSMFVIPDIIDGDHTYHYWIRLNTTSANQLHLSIWSKDKYLERQSHTQIAYGMYLGIFLIMAVYNLFLGFSTKDRSYLFYVGYILAFTALQACLQGYSFQYLWPQLPLINNYAIPSMVLITILFASLFAQSFLQTKEYSPRHHQVLSGLAIFSAIAVMLQIFISYEVSVRVAIWASLATTITLLSSAISMYIKGHRFAQLFLLAWTILLIGAVIYGFASLGYFPINAFTRHAAQIGSAIEVVLLSLALADRINRMKAEKREIEKQAKTNLENKNKELNHTLELLRQSNSLKDEFLATISHELRTPMNGIEGSLQVVQDTIKDQTASKHLNAAHHSAHLMTQLVESLLEYSELQSGNWKLNTQPFNLESLIIKCTKYIQSENSNKEVDFKISGNHKIPYLLVGDGDRIQHLIFQLLDNAFKFTHQGTVTLAINASEQDQSYDLDIEVADTGIGIPPAQLKEIFEGFRQVDGSFSRQYGGLGIGLSLCKAIVDQMQGQISVDSLPQKGTTFSIKLTLPKGAQIQTNQSTTSKLTGNPKILVVEDNPVNQMTLVAMMKKLGCQVEKANNGEEAVRISTEQDFDCILMDCQMPIMDGFDATKIIRTQNNSNAQTPIIAVTANAMSGDRDRCIESGMNDYIRKPIKLDVISERLLHWLIDKAA